MVELKQSTAQEYGHSKKLWCLLLLLTLVGCSSVKITTPLPSGPELVDEEQLEGTWSIEDATIHVEFTANPVHTLEESFNFNGIANIAWVEWDSTEQEFKMKRAKAIPTRGKEHNFLSVRYQESDEKWEGYYFVMYRITDDGDMILWLPIPEAFEELIKSKALNGVESGSETTITSASASLLEIIDVRDNQSFFNYTQPLILKKSFSKKKADD